jgi:multicomponent Na+:H+ antiporter subunit E
MLSGRRSFLALKESRINPSDNQAPAPPAKRSLGPYILTFLVCMATWVVLSGKFDFFHLFLGVVSSTIVSFASGDMLFSARNVKRVPGQWLRFIPYVPWLLFQIFRANMHVMRLVFHPRMQELINPQMVKFKSRLDGEMARFVYANSITLTPGTITVYVSLYGTYTVHAIDDASAEGLPGEMESRVATIFGE